MAGTVGRISAYDELYGGPTRQGGGGIFQPPSMSDIAGGAFPALGRDYNLPGYNLPVGFNPGSFNWFPTTKQTKTASMGQAPVVFGEPRSTAGKIGDDIFVRLARVGGGDYGFFTELIAKEIVKRWGPSKHHIFGVGGISLPDNPPQILLDQEITRNPITIRKYRYFSGYWKESAAPLVTAGNLTQQRLEALSRIFPGMIDISKELAKGRERMYGPSKSPQDAMNNIQNYANDLYKAEGFIDEVFADKMAQGYIKRKTNMPFEDFKKGFEDRSQKVITQNIRIPQAQKSLADARKKATRGSQTRQGKGASLHGKYYGTTPLEKETQKYMSQYEPITRSWGGRTGNRFKETTGYREVIKEAVRGGGKTYNRITRPAIYGQTIGVDKYNDIVRGATIEAERVLFPQQKQIQEYQDLLAADIEAGPYSAFDPLSKDWTPGEPQAGSTASYEPTDLPQVLNMKPFDSNQGYYFTGFKGSGPIYAAGMPVPGLRRSPQGRMLA
jgi:hypothetical protein